MRIRNNDRDEGVVGKIAHPEIFLADRWRLAQRAATCQSLSRWPRIAFASSLLPFGREGWKRIDTILVMALSSIGAAMADQSGPVSEIAVYRPQHGALLI